MPCATGSCFRPHCKRRFFIKYRPARKRSFFPAGNKSVRSVTPDRARQKLPHGFFRRSFCLSHAPDRRIREAVPGHNVRYMAGGCRSLFRGVCRCLPHPLPSVSRPPARPAAFSTVSLTELFFEEIFAAIFPAATLSGAFPGCVFPFVPRRHMRLHFCKICTYFSSK